MPRSGSSQLTQPEMVLLSLHRVAKGTTDKVAYEELVLQAWRDYPATFALRNHPEHPDASDIHKKLYGTLKQKRLIEPLRNKMFRLTDQGVREAERLLSGEPPEKNSVRLSRADEAFIAHARSTRAYGLWSSNEKNRLIDFDAKLFFQFSTGTPTAARHRKLESAQDAIEAAVQADIPGARDLQQLAAYIVTKFEDLWKETRT